MVEAMRERANERVSDLVKGLTGCLVYFSLDGLIATPDTI